MTQETTMRITILAAAVLALGACSSTPPRPSSAEGARVSVNSPAMIELLMQQRAETEFDRMKRAQRAALFVPKARQFVRAVDTESLGDLPGNRGVLRTVSVPFAFNSVQFDPTPAQQLRMRELFASATRIEVRGRTDGIGATKDDAVIARARAEAAKRYLIDRGVPGRLIAVYYLAGGDYVGDNAQARGRSQNRRVDIEFFVPDMPDVPDTALSGHWQEVAGS